MPRSGLAPPRSDDASLGVRGTPATFRIPERMPSCIRHEGFSRHGYAVTPGGGTRVCSSIGAVRGLFWIIGNLQMLAPLARGLRNTFRAAAASMAHRSELREQGRTRRYEQMIMDALVLFLAGVALLAIDHVLQQTASRRLLLRRRVRPAGRLLPGLLRRVRAASVTM